MSDEQTQAAHQAAEAPTPVDRADPIKELDRQLGRGGASSVLALLAIVVKFKEVVEFYLLDELKETGSPSATGTWEELLLWTEQQGYVLVTVRGTVKPTEKGKEFIRKVDKLLMSQKTEKQKGGE